jgi:hypothetical protein
LTCPLACSICNYLNSNYPGFVQNSVGRKYQLHSWENMNLVCCSQTLKEKICDPLKVQNWIKIAMSSVAVA